MDRRGAVFLVTLLLALLPACAGQTQGAGGPYPQFAEYEDREVESVAFAGELELPADSLRAVIVTREPECWILFVPVCLPFTDWGRDAYRLDLSELSRDVVRLQLYYRDHGYYGTRIAPSVASADGGGVRVRFAIAPGDVVALGRLEVEGTEDVIPAEQVLELLPLAVGEPFRRIDFLTSADTILAELQARGHAYGDVFRNYSIDTIADIAEAQFVALPGPVVEVDTILFEGGGRLSEATLRRQIPLREGELLRLPQLTESQRRLYSLEMVQFASVQLAPDSLQLDPDSTTATVLARVVEAPQFVVEAAGGLGTVDCLRTEASWLDRNFRGGGRTLEVTGALSRIGVGDPVDWGLDGSICSGAENQIIGISRSLLDYLNYSVAADFEQPRLLNTRTELAVNLHWERLTELNAFLRESRGGRVSLGRDIGRGSLLNVGFTVDHGRTLANPVAFCIGFDICAGEDYERLQTFRWSNALTATTVLDRTRTLAGFTRGYAGRAAVGWASPLLLSDNEYLRTIAEGSVYRPIRPGWVFAGNLRVGSFVLGRLGVGEGYIPPEQRFYAGGPNSVRGFGRNQLGPTAYVWTMQLDDEGLPVSERIVPSALGGTQTVVASGEVRGQSPFLSEFVRVAGFVDAGQVWAPGSDVFDSGSVCGSLRVCVTPGVGLRFITPVGPIRLDVAYNGYPPISGNLYFVDPGTGALRLVDPDYQPDPPSSFWSRLRFSFAVGQAF